MPTRTRNAPARKTAPEKRTSDELAPLARYRRAVDYLAAAQVYLKSNALLEEPLRPEHIKDRLLGHWGTCPGINLVYAHLNRLILRTETPVLLITGPGHGAAANLANMYLEGTLGEFFPELTRNRDGLERFIRWFSWPGRFPSHLNPGYPGVIHEGGELGYALATAFGAALDNPDLLVACIVGDGEAETGPTAGAWHSTKFLNPATDGAVLPILHLNGYKIANPTIFVTMTDEELTALFTGYGYQVRIVDYSNRLDADCDAAFAWAHEQIAGIQQRARRGRPDERPRWPMLILRTPKGMGGPDHRPIARRSSSPRTAVGSRMNVSGAKVTVSCLNSRGRSCGSSVKKTCPCPRLATSRSRSASESVGRPSPITLTVMPSFSKRSSSRT